MSIYVIYIYADSYIVYIKILVFPNVKQQVIPALVESDAPGKGKESITPTSSKDSS